MYAGVDEVLERPAVLGPVLDLLDRALDLRTGHRDRTADLGDQDAAQPLLVLFQRLVQLGQAVVAELEVARPVVCVERPPRRADRALHVGDGAVGRLPGHFLAGRVDDVECRAAAGELQFAVDQHPLVTGEHAGFSLHFRHGRQLYKLLRESVSPFALIPAAWRSCARNWSSSSLRTM